MKNFLSFALTVALFLSSLVQSPIYCHYLLKKQYYAKVLCENKARPKMHCEGKCQLKKELKEQEEKSQSPISSPKVKQETTQFHQTSKQFSIETNDLVKSYPVFCLIGKPQSPGFSIFHPPTV